jgi:hypothetical protein
MTLQVPNLDDRRFDDLLAEARALLPAHAPGWTDYNASDPGITLLELFAWLAEMLVYRSNQVTDAHTIAFLRLLQAPEWPTADRPTWEWQLDWDVEERTRLALRELRDTYRAVTVEDWERLASEAARPGEIARVHCVPRRALATGRDDDRPGTVSNVVIPAVETRVLLVSGSGTEDGSAATLDGNERPLPLRLGVGDALLFGASTPFSHVHFDLEPPGRGYTLQFEVTGAEDWQDAVATDLTSGWQSSGRVELEPTGWSSVPFAGSSLYWLRITTSTEPAPESIAAARRIVAPFYPEPSDELIAAVRGYLEPRRILTTSFEVLGPRYVDIGVEALVARNDDTPDETVRDRVLVAIEEFTSPLRGGADGTGWPFGRALYVSELYALLERLPGVAYVPEVRVYAADGATTVEWNDDGEQVGLVIGPHTLPRATLDRARVVVGPRFVPVTATAALTKLSSVADADARRVVREALRTLFAPATGLDRTAAWNPADAELEHALGTAVQEAGTAVTLTIEADPDHRGRTPQGEPRLELGEGERVDLRTFVEL